MRVSNPFFLLGVLTLTTTNIAIAQRTVVSPGEFATTEMPNVANLVGFPSYRLQQVYGAADFESLGPGPHSITRIDWRPGSEMTETISYPSDLFVMKFSTTQIDPGDVLDRIFDNIIGSGEQTVFDGPVTLTTENLGPAEGPKAFDYGLDLQTPFLYDPAAGNLLMDLTVINGQGPLLLDFSFADTNTTSFHWTGTLGHESNVAALPEDVGGQTGGHVLQFTVAQPGDVDGDGDVDFSDFLVLSANFGMSGNRADGDLDNDGQVAFSDFLLLSSNFGETAAGVSVPEPSASFLACCATVALLFRRRRGE